MDKNYYFTKTDESKKGDYDILRINHDETARQTGEYIDDPDEHDDYGRDKLPRTRESRARGKQVHVLVTHW
jgi:hypothetical protein